MSRTKDWIYSLMGIKVGTKYSEVMVADGSGNLYQAGVLITASAAEINAAADVSGRIVNCAAATLGLSAATHGDRIVTLNKADGQAITVPAATGSGVKFTLILGTTVTSVGTTITLTGNDTYVGNAVLINDSAAASTYAAGASDEVITLDGSTKGGIKGATIELIDIAADVWYARVISSATGTEATPFSSAA